MLLIASGAVPVLLRVVDCVAGVPTVCELKVSVFGVSVSVGAVPVPMRATSRGLPAASSVIVTLAVRGPAAVGVKVTEIVQLALTASVLGPVGQVVVCA